MRKIGLVILGLLLVAGAAQALTLSWTPIIVDSTGDVGTYSRIKSAGANTLIAMYRDSTNTDEKFAKSTTGGLTWTKTVVDTVEHGPGEILAVDEDTYIMAYGGVTSQEVRFAKSTDGGDTWSTSTVSTCGASVCSTYVRMIYTDASTYYIAFLDSTNQDLKLATSIDAGTSWVITNIDTNNVCRVGGFAAFDVNNFVVSYTDGGPACLVLDLHYSVTTNAGASWSPRTFVAANVPGPGGADTVSATKGAFVYASFDGTWTTSIARTQDAFATFVTSNIATPSNTQMPVTDVAYESNTRLLVNIVDCGGTCTSYVSQSDDSGGTFSAFQAVATGANAEVANTEVPFTGSGIAIVSAGKYCVSWKGGANDDYIVSCSSSTGSSVSSAPGNVIRRISDGASEAWGFDWSWIIGGIIVIAVIWGVRNAHPLVISIIGFIGVGIAVSVGMFPSWILLVVTLILCILVGARFFGGESDQE